MHKRLISVFVTTAVLFLGLFGRLYGLSVSSLKAASVGQSTRKQTIAVARGTIYDRYMRPLVNQQKRWAVSMYPYLSDSERETLALTADQRECVREAMECGQRASFFSDKPLPAVGGLVQTEVPVRYGTQTYAVHLLGYTDGDYRGVSGIEKAFDNTLSAYQGTLDVSYAVDAMGRPAVPTEEDCRNTMSQTAGGVKLTLDLDVQRIVQEVLDSMAQAGAVVVSEVESGEVLATASAPTFDPAAVDQYLEAEQAPLLDRTLCNYNVGSVFKILIAAAALEAGVNEATVFPCDGTITVNGIEFACRDHGDKRMLTMREAMAVSCNSYFIQLALALSASPICEMASAAGWYSPISLAQGMETEAAVCPDIEDLSAEAALANVAIGQGDILASVYHVHSLLCAVANQGVLIAPTVYGATVDEYKQEIQTAKPLQTKRLFSERTASVIRDMLESVVLEGTGVSAAPMYASAAGKTGTAETGWTVNGETVVQSWFTGYYPAQQPRYAVTVLSENGGANGATAAPMFAAVCDRLFQAGLVEISQDMY